MAKKTVLLGVTGSIAAYKAAEIASSLVKAGVDVHVLMTESATHLIGSATFQALTGNPVVTRLFHPVQPGAGMPHIDLPARADLFLIAPATANILGKIASGIADDALSTAALSSPAPMLVAPAMNERMWAHPAVQANVSRLKTFGVEILGPEAGRLACGTEGTGRLEAPERIVKRCLDRLGTSG
ncbi:MAG: flavoprotein [Planctomycetota bacterium]|jgi:phosphopantothenoylcysteine decarboxylase/phosphopantothenate--cysteine ligase